MHDPDQPCLAEALLDVLLPALIRSGDVVEATILALADDLDGQAAREAVVSREQELTQMATALRAWAIEAAGPPQSEHSAARRRARMRIVRD